MTTRSRKTYRFGEFEFTSKDAAHGFFGEMRQNMGFGGPITNPAHILAVSELLRGHVEYDEKVKCGVRQFLTAPAPDHNSTCFWIEREDGSMTDFGFGACAFCHLKSSCNRAGESESGNPRTAGGNSFLPSRRGFSDFDHGEVGEPNRARDRIEGGANSHFRLRSSGNNNPHFCPRFCLIKHL
jgi:hypothetical protein